MLVFHVSCFSIGLLAAFVAFISGALLLWQNRGLKSKSLGFLSSRLPSIQTLDRITFWAIVGGFPFITTGMVLGIFLAHSTWRVDWLSDPLVIGTLIFWFWYCILLAFRLAFKWYGRRFAIFNIIGFVVLLFALFGMQKILGLGLHPGF